jgi:hypothetical protein
MSSATVLSRSLPSSPARSGVLREVVSGHGGVTQHRLLARILPAARRQPGLAQRHRYVTMLPRTIDGVSI